MPLRGSAAHTFVPFFCIAPHVGNSACEKLVALQKPRFVDLSFCWLILTTLVPVYQLRDDRDRDLDAVVFFC
ncbi:MAG TPA: hypothetical protein DHW22_08325 [Planctomycetaceae bacterium]|nr:hypothetical protein [Planctomycetaceae bacterium]